MDETNVFAFVY